MKNKHILICSLLGLCGPVLHALQINFNNSANGAFTTYLPVTDSDDNPISIGLGSISVGYFTDEGAVAGGDFSSFQQFGSGTSSFGAFSTPSIFGVVSSEATNSGSSFIGENISVFISYNSEFLVAKSTITFIEQTGPTDEQIVDLSDLGTQYLFGGDASTVDLGGGFVPSVALAPVPEPSTFAALAGLFALSFVMVRRRRA